MKNRKIRAFLSPLTLCAAFLTSDDFVSRSVVKLMGSVRRNVQGVASSDELLRFVGSHKKGTSSRILFFP
jgi:hypothetical protein